VVAVESAKDADADAAVESGEAADADAAVESMLFRVEFEDTTVIVCLLITSTTTTTIDMLTTCTPLKTTLMASWLPDPVGKTHTVDDTWL
jgi:hypothetical protein